MKPTREVFQDIWHLMTMRQKIRCIWWHRGFRFWRAASEFCIRRMHGINFSMDKASEEVPQ